MPQDKFSSDNPYVLGALLLTANNNQADLNVVIQESDFLRATSPVFAQQGLTNSTANPASNATLVAQQTIGNAVGQGEITPGCFIGSTNFTLFDGSLIKMEEVYKNYADIVALSFTETEERTPGVIKQAFRRQAPWYVLAYFSDGSVDGVLPEHRYYTPSDIYLPLKYLIGKHVVHEDGSMLTLEGLEVVRKQVDVYNVHIETYQNYCANRKRVHNLKRPDEG